MSDKTKPKTKRQQIEELSEAHRQALLDLYYDYEQRKLTLLNKQKIEMKNLRNNRGQEPLTSITETDNAHDPNANVHSHGLDFYTFQLGDSSGPWHFRARVPGASDDTVNTAFVADHPGYNTQSDALVSAGAWTEGGKFYWTRKSRG